MAVCGRTTINALSTGLSYTITCTEFDTNSYMMLSAVALTYCTNVRLNGITIEKSRGIGLMIVNDLGSNVNIESSIFGENNLHSDFSNGPMPNSQVYGGGGVYIIFRHVLCQTYSPTVLHFQNCTFENNTSNTSLHDHLYTNVQGKARVGYGRGGGVYVLFGNGIANISVFFSG